MTDTGKRGWGWFWAFVGVGAAGAVAVLGMLTIGAFVLFPTLAVFILLVIRGGGGRPMWGLVTGAGVTLIVIGLNWHTSPAVCEGTAQAGVAVAEESEWSPDVVTSAPGLPEVPSVTGCESTWDPWPMGLPGGVLMIAGLVAYVLASRAVARPGSS